VALRHPVKITPEASPAEALAAFFQRNGYVRWQNAERLGAEGPQRYKKGSEVRLVADTVRELRLIRRLLRQAGFKPGRPFRKAGQYRQPLYGQEVVAKFLALVQPRAGARRRKATPEAPRPPRDRGRAVKNSGRSLTGRERAGKASA
jgi:hypothetical protein